MTDNKSLESSWCICEATASLSESQYSNISSLNSEPTPTNVFQSFKQDDLNSSFNSDIQDPLNRSNEDLEDIYNSYNVKINDVVQVLSAKNTEQMSSIVNTAKDKSDLRKAATLGKMSNFSELNNKDRLLFKRSNEQIKNMAQSNILNDLKNTGGIKDVIKFLSNKQKSFINQAKESEEDTRSLQSYAKEIDEINKIRRIAAFDESKFFLADDENIIYTLDKLKQNDDKIPVEIVSPIHDEPNININELLDENQTDIQQMISKVKDKNKDFIESIFDY